MIVKYIELDLIKFRNQLYSLTQCDVGLERYIIEHYNYRYIGENTYFKVVSDYLLNFMYKKNRVDYKYTDILDFFRERDLVSKTDRFKELLDLYISSQVDIDMIDAKVTRVITDTPDRYVVEIEYTVPEDEI